jgi:O-antigen/teichoic acid export membrane protein
MDLKSQVQKLARNAASLAVGGVIAQLAFTLLEILIARELGAAAYGVFVTAYAWTLLGTYLMEIGTPQWMIQEGARNNDRLPTLLGSTLTVNLAMFAGLYLALVGASLAFDQNAVLSLMLIILPYGLVMTLQNGLGAVYSSYQTMQVSAFFQGLAPVAILLVYFAYASREVTLSDVGVAYVAGGAIVTGAWFAYTLRRVRPRISLRDVRETLRSSYQYGLTGVLGQLYFKADVVMLSALAGLREAGIYAAAFKLVELVFKVAVLSGRVFAPALFKASHTPGRSFDVFASMMTRLLAVSGLMAGLISFVLADELILLMFGETYRSSVPVLRILGGVMAVKCMMIALQLLLSSVDLHVQRVSGLTITLVAHIGVSALLIPRFGAVGAACGTLLSGVLLIILYAISFMRRRRFSYVRWIMVPSCLATAFSLISLLTGLNAYAGALVAVTAFTVSLVGIGFVRREEIRFVLHTVLARKET